MSPSSSNGSPKRRPSKSIPLQERSQSQTNRPALRLVRDDSDEFRATTTSQTPYPTKPAHILLPSTLRERRLGSNEENIFPGTEPTTRFAIANTKAQRRGSESAGDSSRPTSPLPTITLKRSVKTLRDLYEAQAERSRPSTATSPVGSPLLRPSTAGSGIRSVGSRDGLRGRPPWELFNKPSVEDLARLPSLDEVASFSRRERASSSPTESSFVAASSSSPNLVTYGKPSSPILVPAREVARPLMEPIELSSSSDIPEEDSSSPNVVRNAESSSPNTASAMDSSSPNVVMLGSSSPRASSPKRSREFRDEVDSPSTVKRRKSGHGPSETSFVARMGHPPNPASSPPEDDTSPAEDVNPTRARPLDLGQCASSPEDFSETSSDMPESSQSAATRIRPVSAAHSNLQAAIASSPAPSIQYSTVHPPGSTNWAALNVAKRPPKTFADRSAAQFDPRLSTVPSQWSNEHEWEDEKDWEDEEDDMYGTGASVDDDTSQEDSYLEPPARAYLASSREVSGSTVRMILDEDRHEALDSISALPPTDYRPSPQMVQRPSGLLSFISSSGSRSNSMRNSVDTRLNSMRSYSDSRNDSMRSIRRPGSSSSLVSNLPIPTWARRYYSGGIPKDYFYSISQITSSTNLTPRQSTSTPRTPMEHVSSLFRTRTRPTVQSARLSHLEPGLGPLVSNPVNPVEEVQIRPASLALHPADPRAHWAGVDERALARLQSQDNRPYSPYRFLPGSRRDWSPHLHQDYRAGGHPRRSLWHAPSLDENNERIFNWRNAQLFAFILGFVFPLSWFVAAFLPLPRKPNLSSEYVQRIPALNLEAQQQQKQDIADDVRYENARWWRILNRFMCAVGVVFIGVVITLAVLGTRPGGFSG